MRVLRNLLNLPQDLNSGHEKLIGIITISEQKQLVLFNDLLGNSKFQV